MVIYINKALSCLQKSAQLKKIKVYHVCQLCINNVNPKLHDEEFIRKISETKEQGSVPCTAIYELLLPVLPFCRIGLQL
jgi:hypothetical protein